MTVQPQTLPSVGTTQYSSYLWKWRYSTTTHEIYDLEHNPGSWGAGANTTTYTIKVGKSGETDENTWTDHGSDNPTDVTISGSAFSAVTENSNGTVSLYGNSGGTNMLLYVFTKPTVADWISSGPTVTSITVANEISSTRQFTVTHTGTLTGNDISYKINGNDITVLGSPNTPITNIQTTATGSTFDSYTSSSNGYHLINIGSQYLEFYKTSDTVTEDIVFPELENAGLQITFPNTAALWLAKAPGYDSVTLYNDGAQYKGTSQFNGYDRIEYLWVGTKWFNNADPSLRGFKMYKNYYIDEPPARWDQGNIFYIDPVARYESTGLLYSSFYAGLTHVSNGGYYRFDFVSLLAQATTNTSNGGGKRRRYPIISTNLFDRQRSIYSIGNTHKDETLF